MEISVETGVFLLVAVKIQPLQDCTECLQMSRGLIEGPDGRKKQSKITLYFRLWPSQRTWDLTLFNHQKRLLSFFHRLWSHGAVIEDFAKRLVPRLTARDLANLTWSFAAAKLTHEFLKHVVDLERWNRRAGFEKHELHRQPVHN